MSPDLRVVAVLSLMASACASGPQIGDEPPRFSCGTEPSGWILSEAPKNADDYRRLASESPHVKANKVSANEWGQYDQETWLIRSSGEVILCLADGHPWDAWATRFWKFTAPNAESGELEVADSGETIKIG